MAEYHDILRQGKRLHAQAVAHVMRKTAYDIAAHFCYQAAVRALRALLAFEGTLTQETSVLRLMGQVDTPVPFELQEAGRFLDRFRVTGSASTAAAPAGGAKDASMSGVIRGCTSIADAPKAVEQAEAILVFVENLIPPAPAAAPSPAGPGAGGQPPVPPGVPPGGTPA